MLQDQLLRPVQGLAAWRGDQIADSDDWIHLLSDDQIAELEQVGTRFLEDDPDLRTAEAAEYPLPICGPAIRAWGQAMDMGRGFVLVRGLRANLYSDALSTAIFFVIGLHLGTPMRQSELGDMVQHVVATTDKRYGEDGAASIRVRDRLNYHSDSSDVVSLMCLRPAKEGGASSLVSSAMLYNEVLARRPDLAPLLFEDWHYDWRLQDNGAPENSYASPMMAIVDGVFSAYIGNAVIRSAQRYPDVPRLTPGQLELLDLVDAITTEDGMALHMDFRPGDMQWLLNYAALHARTEFRDHAEPARKRHLLRLWLKRNTGRPIPERFGRYAVRARDQARGAEVAREFAKFRISEAAIPRLDWGSGN